MISYPEIPVCRYGIYNNSTKNSYMIGNTKAISEDDNVIVGEKKYPGTSGLWKLITSIDAPDPRTCTALDYNYYEQILFETDSLYQNYDRSTEKPRSNTGNGYKNLIKGIWVEMKSPRREDGMKKYTENQVGYKYINNLSELYKGLYSIASGAQFQYHIFGKVVEEDDEKDLKNDNTVKLVDDFPAFLFPEIEVRKHNELIDKMRMLVLLI
ncbi:hypothetical protein JTB14_007398 [Gonioctena quinquepunctata]|nr:hypothetical protein JTB14_007398 [Gonioctena quinquepunctata]